MEPIYYDEFASYDDLPYGDDNPKPEEVIYAGYSSASYEGWAIIVFQRAGKLYENNDSHCSCFGLEDWSPEETSAEALLMRENWPGLADALAKMQAPS